MSGFKMVPTAMRRVGGLLDDPELISMFPQIAQAAHSHGTSNPPSVGINKRREAPQTVARLVRAQPAGQKTVSKPRIDEQVRLG